MSAMPTVVELQPKKFYADPEAMDDIRKLEKYFNCTNFSQLMRTVLRRAAENLTES